MRRPVGTLRVPGVERPEPEAAEGRSKDRIYILDRAILRPPVFHPTNRPERDAPCGGARMAERSRHAEIAEDEGRRQ